MYQNREISLPVGLKPRNWNQATWNDCDVISRHLVTRKTDFSHIFLLWAEKLRQEMVQKSVVYMKITKKSVFRETKCPEMTLQSVLVSSFWFLTTLLLMH